MPDSRRVTTIERRLGFKWKLGISRSKGESCKIRIIKALSDDIDDAKHKWVHIPPKELRSHSGFERHCLTLYDKHAHRLWPPPPADRSAWLVDAEFNDWEGEYPRNLSIDQHDHLLKDLFLSLVFEKCVRYYENQKQDERRRFKLSVNPDTSELFSPAPESELEGSTNLSHQNEQSNIFSDSTARMQDTQDSEAATSLGKNEADRGMGAPVAQMIPHTVWSIRRDGSNSRTRPVVLDDSDVEDMSGSPSEPANGTSSSWSSVVEQQRRHVEKNDYAENNATPGRKRPAPNGFEDISPAKKSPRKGNVRVKGTGKSSSGLQSHPKAQASTATGRLRLKLSAPTNPSGDSGRKAPPPHRPVAKPDIDSTIHVSNPRKDENGKSTLFTKNGSRPRPNPVHDGRAGGRLVSLTSPEKRLPATAKVGSQAASRVMPPPSESESTLSSAMGASGSIYDFVASPDGSRQATPHAGWKQATSYPTRSESTVTPTTGVLNVGSLATSQTTSSLRNQCDKTSSTRHLPIQSASDGSAMGESGRQPEMQTDKIVDATNDRDSLQSSKANSSVAHHAYVEEGSKVEDSELTARNQVNAVTERISSSHYSPDTRASIRNVESQTMSLADEQSALMSKAIAATQIPADKAAAIQTKMGQNIQLSDQPKSRLDLLAELKAKMEAAADSSQSPPRNPKGEQTTSAEAPQSKTTIQGPTPKKLFLQLSTSEANVQQFVVVSFDFSVEELFERVQKRMNERLDNQAIRFLQLRLPTQNTNEDPYRIQRDDPDTWEWFLEMAREVEGSKIKVLADVEL